MKTDNVFVIAETVLVNANVKKVVSAFVSVTAHHHQVAVVNSYKISVKKQTTNKIMVCFLWLYRF